MGTPTGTLARQRAAEGPLKGGHIGVQAIDRQQQRPAAGHLPHLPDQGGNQVRIPVGADHATQPQPGRHHDRQRHPVDPGLRLDPNFIGLHLLQIQRLSGDQVRMDRLAVLAGSLPPGAHGAFVVPKGLDDRRDRAAIRQQSDDPGNGFIRRAQAVEGRAAARCKRPATHLAAVAAFFPAMDADIVFAKLPSCRAVRVRAKYTLRVHLALSFPRQKELCTWTRSFSSRPTTATVYCGATRRPAPLFCTMIQSRRGGARVNARRHFGTKPARAARLPEHSAR